MNVLIWTGLIFMFIAPVLVTLYYVFRQIIVANMNISVDKFKKAKWIVLLITSNMFIIGIILLIIGILI